MKKIIFMLISVRAKKEKLSRVLAPLLTTLREGCGDRKAQTDA